MGWIIAAAIIAFRLFLRVSVKAKIDGDMELTLGVWIFRFPLYPTKEKTVKLSDYKTKKFRNKQAKLEEKKSGKKKKSKKKGSDRKHIASKANMVEAENDDSDIMGLLGKITSVINVFLNRFGHHLHIKVKRLVIIIATPDAAKTAVLYGAACGAVQCLMELLNDAVHLRLPNSENLCVVPDFTSEKTTAEADITFSFSVYQIFDILIRSAIAYFKES